MTIKKLLLSGDQARTYINELASLRLDVFYEYPYLYEGTLEYEKNYLETYFKAKHAFILILKDDDKVIGATTGIWANEEEESFKAPFTRFGINPEEVFYFGESVLLKEYRGQGLGKIFFEERERYARSLSFIKYLAFCAVQRSEHPLEPKNYRPLDSFWESQAFKKIDGLTTTYHWRDRGEENETNKLMQFWIKEIK